MQTTVVTIHRLSVSMDCGCVAVGEYADAACKEQQGKTEFHPCGKHKEDPGVEMLKMVLVEMAEKEARDRKAPEVERSIRFEVADGSESMTAVRPNRPHRKVLDPKEAAGLGVDTGGGEVTVTDLPAKADSKPRIARVGAGGSGARVPAVPGAHRVARGVSAEPVAQGGPNAPVVRPLPPARNRTATVQSLNVDEYPEDQRVTELVEDLDFLGLGEIDHEP